MRYSKLILWAGFWVLILSTLRAQAQTNNTVQVISAGKRATALVVTPDGTGSSFCIHASGVFVTNAHVVEGHTRAKVVLYPGETDQLVLHARVTHADDELDLALLCPDPPLYAQVRKMPPLTVLPLGQSDALFETTPIAVFGFPFGTQLALDDREMPSVTVSVGRITSLRKLGGVLKEIQLDAALNPGNSGGPVITDQGQVVGIVHASVGGAQGLNFAIPVNGLRELMKLPEMRFDLPELEWDRRLAPQSFKIQILPVTPFATEAPNPRKVYAVEFEVGTEDDWKTIPVARIERTDGTAEFRVTGVLFREDLAEDDLQYRITLRENGRTIGFRQSFVPITGVPEAENETPVVRKVETPAGLPDPFAPVQDPVTKHWYKLERSNERISFAVAKAASESKTFRGLQGHLVSITSEAERHFLVQNVLKNLPQPSDTAWIGGVQKPRSQEPGGGWFWTTGEFVTFTSWAPGEPNHANGNEFLTEIRRDGLWNDVAESGRIPFYIVEFENANTDGIPGVNEPLQGPNGHWYQLVTVPEGVLWNQAKATAEAMRFRGLEGHLATISDAAEQKFITERILSVLARVTEPTRGDAAWLGGTLNKNIADRKSGWSWITGEAMQYTNWLPGQPDDTNASEYLLQTLGNGTWNDVGPFMPTPHLVVEFEP